MDEKTCTQCRQTKPRVDFYVHPSTGDGRMRICKECHKSNVRTNYRENIGHYREYERSRAMLPHRVKVRAAYQATTEGREAVRRAHLRSNERFPERRAARVIAGNAIRNGALVQQPCEVCGATKVDAHHDDYSQPLNVRWLCRKHHREHHRSESRHREEQAA